MKRQNETCYICGRRLGGHVVREMLDALIMSESAMFHVLADGGFNTPEDEDAMKSALVQSRMAIKIAKATE